MIIHIEICDVCKLIVRGGLPVDTYSSGELRWDVCRGCDPKPFSSSHARWHNATWPVLPLPPGHVIPTFYVDQAKGDTLKDAFERERVSAGIPGPVAAGEADDVTWSDTELVNKVFEIITSQELPFATERATTEAVEFLRALGEHLERDR